MKFSDLPKGLQRMLGNEKCYPNYVAKEINDALEQSENLRDFADLVESRLGDLEAGIRDIKISFLRFGWENEVLFGPKKFIKKGVITDNPQFSKG